MLIDAKSNLAKLMASENIIVEQKSVKTAHFNLKTRTLVIPKLKEDLNSVMYDLFLGHEVGHALFTPLEGWHDSVVNLKVKRSILNVCEDSRIEKLIRRKFPGLKMSFIKAYRDLMDQDFFGLENMSVDKMNTELNLIDRINLHCKCGASLGITFDEKETALLREVEEAESFPQTLDIALKIQEYMKEQYTEEKEQGTESQKVSGEPGDEDESEEGDTDGEGLGQSTDSTPMDDAIESDTDNSFREKEKTLFNKPESSETTYANIPSFDAEDFVIDYKAFYKDVKSMSAKCKVAAEKVDTTLFKPFSKETNKVVSYLTKEFELRRNAEQNKRAGVAKTGDLDMDKIYSYKFKEDIFRRMTVVPQGKSHGLVLYLDWSGSMKPYMDDTIRQTITLAMFCKKVNIPFEVYAFSDRIQSTGKINYKVGDIHLGNFVLFNVLSSRMNKSDFTYAANTLMSKIYDYPYSYAGLHLGGTPLNEAIISAFDLLPKFQKANKLQIVNTVFLTDGDGSALNRVHEAGADYHKSNIILRDPVTFASIKNDTSYTNNSKGFLFLLKQRCDCNVIGFRILTKRDLRSYLSHSHALDVDTKIASFDKDKSLVIDNFGFDEYYLLKSDKLSTEVDKAFEITSTNTSSIVSSFKKYTKGHIGNRIILNRFIGLIS